MTDGIDRSPVRVSTTLAIGTAFVATASSALVTVLALAVAIPGASAVLLGLYAGSRRTLALGVMGLLGGAMIAGMAGAPALTTLVSVTAGVLTWDTGTTAISVGRQLGREADTERLQTVHAATSTGVGVVTITVAYGVFRSIGGTHPVAAVFFLLLATALLAGALR